MDESLMSANRPAKAKTPMIIIGVALILVALVLILWQQKQAAPIESEPEADANASQSVENNSQMPAPGNQEQSETEATNQENQNPENSTSVKTFTIKGQNFSFNPAEIRVKRGDKVKIVFQNESGYHDWMLEGYNVRTKQMTGPATETVEFTADQAGTFEYYCSVGTHRQMGMKGNLIVE